MNKLIILLVIILIVYALVREERSFKPLPLPKPKREFQPYRRPKVNRKEDDLIIIPPDISYHSSRIQELIRLMWTDLRKMIKFKNEADYYDSERWYKKKDCQEALQFTNYQQFKGFQERWKHGFDDWQKWEEYLKEWDGLK